MPSRQAGVVVAHQYLVEVAGGVFVVRENNDLLPMQIGFKEGFELLELGVVCDADVFDVVPDFRQRVDVLLQSAVQPAPVIFSASRRGSASMIWRASSLVIHRCGE